MNKMDYEDSPQPPYICIVNENNFKQTLQIMKTKMLILWVANALLTLGQFAYAQETSPLLPEATVNTIQAVQMVSDDPSLTGGLTSQSNEHLGAGVTPAADDLLHAKVTLSLIRFVQNIYVDEDSTYHFEDLRCELPGKCPATLY
jgi:hypothetical protein